jgi:hypothetical protein
MTFLRMVLTAAKWLAAGYVAVLVALLLAWGVIALLNTFGADL